MTQADHGMARMQELLSSYYGMQDKESEAESQRNIDAPGFNASIYVKEMLQTMGLNELLQRDDKLIKEIKELDTNMQMLVYENYNKFISATDTIRKMKTNVASMEVEVERVVKSMDVITDKSESINVALAPHRSKVEKLIGVRRLLKRLEFIFELPQRLTSAVKQEDYATATKYYLVARRILGRYDHITSFKAIQIEAEKTVQQLEQLLARRLLNPQLTSEQVCESVTLLAQLDACTEEHKQHFLDWHQTFFEKRLAQYETKTSAHNDESVIYWIKTLTNEVLTPLSNVFRVYKQHFLPDLDTKLKATAGRGRLSMVFHDDAFATFAKETFAVYLRVCAVQFQRPHVDFGSLSEVQSLLAETGELLDPDSDPDAFAGAEEEYFVLMWVLKNFVAQVKEIDAIVPPCRLAKGAIEIVESCVRFQIDLVFRKLRVETLTLLEKAHQQVTTNSRHSSRTQSNNSNSGGGGNGASNYQAPSVLLMAQDMASTFTDMMKQVLKQMEPLVLTGATILSEMSRLFSDLVQTQFYHFLKWFTTSMLTYTKPKRAFELPSSSFASTDETDVALPWLDPTPQFLIYLAGICRELASEGISECLQVLIECLPPAEPTHHQQIGAGESGKKGVEVTHMIQVAHETYDEIIKHVVKVYGGQLAALVREGVLTTPWWKIRDEPRSVLDAAVNVIDATFRYGKEIAIALGDEQSAFVGGSNSRTGSRDFRRRTSTLRSRGGGAGAMQLDIERIFAKRIQIFQVNTELTTEWFVQGMLKMSIKAYGEWIREYELTKYALQQVQLDAEFLRTTTVQFVSDSQELESLLSDLLSNAREQALEDELMEQSNVVAIVSTKSTQVLARRM